MHRKAPQVIPSILCLSKVATFEVHRKTEPEILQKYEFGALRPQEALQVTQHLLYLSLFEYKQFVNPSVRRTYALAVQHKRLRTQGEYSNFWN